MHLANTTNNRLESHNQKLKDLTQRSSTLCERSLGEIACLLMTQHAEITINFVGVTRQVGSYDCGLYAIAYAAALAYGHDPGTHQYCQVKMRPHLQKC